MDTKKLYEEKYVLIPQGRLHNMFSAAQKLYDNRIDNQSVISFLNEWLSDREDFEIVEK